MKDAVVQRGGYRPAAGVGGIAGEGAIVERAAVSAAAFNGRGVRDEHTVGNEGGGGFAPDATPAIFACGVSGSSCCAVEERESREDCVVCEIAATDGSVPDDRVALDDSNGGAIGAL